MWEYEPQLNARGCAGVSADAVRAGHIRALERAHRVTVDEPCEGIFLPINLRMRRSVFNSLNARNNPSSTHGVVVVVAKGISEVAVSLSGGLLGCRRDEWRAQVRINDGYQTYERIPARSSWTGPGWSGCRGTPSRSRP